MLLLPTKPLLLPTTYGVPRLSGYDLPAKEKKAIRTVIKFGGSSLATGKRLSEVAALVKMLIAEGQTPTMVCSAMGKTTNNLLNAGDFALKDGKVNTSCDGLMGGSTQKKSFRGRRFVAVSSLERLHPCR